MVAPYKVFDRDVELRVAAARAVGRDQRWPLVKCAFFGSRCSKPFIVPVAVQCTSIDAGRGMDIFFRSYVNALLPRSSLVFNLDHYMIEVDRYPVHSVVEGPWRFTIFTSSNPHDAENQLIQKLHGASLLHILGSVLVAKSNHMGVVQPVCEADMVLIETMLVEVLRTRYRQIMFMSASLAAELASQT